MSACCPSGASCCAVTLLQSHGTLDRVHGAGELDQGTVAHQLHQAAVVFRDGWVDKFFATALTREGVPVRSWIFPGNTSDVTTVTRIQRRSTRHEIGAGHQR